MKRAHHQSPGGGPGGGREPRAREQRARAAAAMSWRTQYLQQGGFAPRLANALAADPGYDVHELMALVRRGCPPELAARIAAPVEPGSWER